MAKTGTSEFTPDATESPFVNIRRRRRAVGLPGDVEEELKGEAGPSERMDIYFSRWEREHSGVK